MAEPPAAGPAQTVEGASLLALQEAAPEPVRDKYRGDRAARGTCARLIAALARLQRGLLGGAPGDALADLARIAAEPAVADDPLLRAALAASMLRARVELARNAAMAATGGHTLSRANPLSAQDALSTERPTPSCLI